MIKTLRVTTTKALENPAIQELVTRAYEHHAFSPGEQGAESVRDAVALPNAVVLVTREDEQFKALAVLAFSGKGVATVQHFYSQKAPKARENMIEAIVTLATANKCHKLLTVDSNRKPRPFRQLFRNLGPSKEVGRVFEFDLTSSPLLG